MSALNKICPVCNEIYNETFKCSKCGGVMIDKGRIVDFMDPYGPQMPTIDSEEYCYHIYKCEKCGNSENKNILKIIV